MVSINTNLSSLMVQNNLSNSTSALNKAIERLTTGYKINHSSDNAANYSIASDYSSKLSSYDVAANNISAGMDLVNTAQSTISLMQNNAERLQALCVQARNGTYGAQSLSAINQESSSILSNLAMMYKNAEYNGISLFDRVSYMVADWLPKAGENGFIDTSEETGVSGTVGLTGSAGTSETVGLTEDLTPKYNGFIADPTARDSEGNAINVNSLKHLSEIDVSTVEGLAEYNSTDMFQIETRGDLEKLANLVNGGTDTTGKTFILSSNIDLGGEEWTPMGVYDIDYNHLSFDGTFDGNGYKISGLKINNPNANNIGLFAIAGLGSEIKNVGIENVNVSGKVSVGGLVSDTCGSITNCYVTGTIKGSDAGGLAGVCDGDVSYCYTSCTVSGEDYIGGLFGEGSGGYITCSYATGDVIGTGYNTGGLVGYISRAAIINSYATGNVTGTSNIGGLAGDAYGSITNSYATGNVTGTSNIGGLVGTGFAGLTITNSFATGNVIGAGDTIGGLAGGATTVTNCYATGTVTGTGNYIGGLVGQAKSSVTNCYATGTVTGTGNYIGGLVGYASGSVTNSYATGNVKGMIGNYTGGLVGSGSTITNSYATGTVTGTGNYTGGLVGSTSRSVTNSYATGNVTGTGDNTGGLVGDVFSVTNCYATGNVTGTGNYTGGLVGYTTIVKNSYATGNVTGNSQIGGLAGMACSVTNTYAIGNVTGSSQIGGLVGRLYDGSISSSYSGGSASGTEYVGGLVGIVDTSAIDCLIENSASYSTVSGDSCVGTLIGADYYYRTSIGGSLNITNAIAVNQEGVGYIGGAVKYENSSYQINPDYDFSAQLENITGYDLLPTDTTLQVGISGNDSSRITFGTNFKYDLSSITSKGIQSDDAMLAINSFIEMLGSKTTQLGAVSNRLESALESTTVSMDNLTSSLSTIKDADIAKVSSDYIKHQILQQASATLLATANQSPSIALQLI